MKLIPTFKVAQKLPLAIVAAALFASAAIGIGSYVVSADTIVRLTEEKLHTAALERARELSKYLSAIRDDLVVTAASPTVASAFGEMQMSWGMTKDATARLKGGYITDNPHPADQRELLVASELRIGYDSAHKRYHPTLLAHRQAHDYGDIYLFDKAGNLLYSVMKRDDFAENFAEGGALAATGLGQAYNSALALEKPGDTAFVDAAPYAAMDGANASFLATPVFSGDTKMGVLAYMMPVAPLNEIMASQLGLGESGETFVVGEDHLFRSDSVFSEGDDVLATAYGSPVVDTVLATGEPASGTWDHYRGTRMLAAAVPMTFADTNWALVATIARDEAMSPVEGMGRMILLVATVVLTGAALLGYLFARRITKPITQLTATMRTLAGGDLSVAVDGAERHDELGDMARAVEVFRNNGLRMREMTESEQAAERARSIERNEMMAQLQRAFGEVVDAAAAGDFSQRIETSFAYETLNSMARSVNDLVDMIDAGLGETGEVLAALADTDLTRRMQGNYRGAFAHLKDDVNRVADNLASVVVALRGTSRTLKAATSEMLSGANDLSDRTSRQSATIEETAAAMEQLASTVADNARRAEDASEKARMVSDSATEGGEVMHRANEAMERITHASDKISNIIGLIDDIAFQTNLLALNASVEAARAGEAGKGFAVVAVEVRRLAQSAAEASSEVKKLIEQSSSEVRGGSKLVAQASAKLLDMLSAATANSAIFNGMAGASREQAASIEEVTAAVRQLDEMTQHNAALVEETNAAIEQTEAQANELDRIVDVFTIEEEAAGQQAA